MKLVTKASQWHKIGIRRRRTKSRGVLSLRITSFAVNSERQSFTDGSGSVGKSFAFESRVIDVKHLSVRLVSKIDFNTVPDESCRHAPHYAAALDSFAGARAYTIH
ncbi:hypothetical protein EVAR_69635_1 [Eumeta japonica]|uniref:Uncharacterized protein n=1 Tax=Eumeta variegata TaxID=151549 RepID=A0A4C1SKU6_EUMVA|nr:hypothetical protein EVAR_69635_1 [Eumeta japonica]